VKVYRIWCAAFGSTPDQPQDLDFAIELRDRADRLGQCGPHEIWYRYDDDPLSWAVLEPAPVSRPTQ